MQAITLAQGCVPRPSVFDRSVRDVVYDLGNLREIDPQRFFAENYVTEGMKQLLTEGFKRLEGTSGSASGAFLLSQSMGGGKTHNLIALGLLALHPQMRPRVMADFHESGALGAVQVVSFTGRNTNTPYGIWHEIAAQLDRVQWFNTFYTPLMAPGDADWVKLLRDQPTLILLDELPPYFEAMQAIPVGGTTLATLTTTAIANLLSAVASGKLPQCCVVMTDLSGTAYHVGSGAMETLRNLDREAKRSVVPINPVRLNSDELYHILRTRLFETDALPDAATVEAVAAAVATAVGDAAKLELTTASAAEMQGAVRDSYPFHPGIRDLFARFRENPGFQQTRALIRIMRLVVARLFDPEHGQARHRYLIGAHDLDLNDSAVGSEIGYINGTFTNAVAHDIAAGGKAVAEQIDGESGTDARDAATLIFLSSLSQAMNPNLGLTRSEIVQYLAAPERDLTALNHALDELQRRAWYLHATANGALYFKNTQNINATLENYADQTFPEDRETELRTQLGEMFKATPTAIYGRVEPLPALNAVTLSPDEITLVIYKPNATSKAEIEEFFRHQTHKNRVLFLTGDPAQYGRVLEQAAYVRAIRTILRDFKGRNMAETDPQMEDAHRLQSEIKSRFYMACREAFQQLTYPTKNGLLSTQVKAEYVANKFQAEEQIRNALKGAFKLREDVGADTNFRKAVEDKFWLNQPEAKWNDVRGRAASDPSWWWHHPRALDDLRTELLARDLWRDLGNGYVARGPFHDKTEATVQQTHRDGDTGEATLKVRAKFGDTIHYAEGETVSTSSPRLVGTDLKTAALTVAFLAVDAKGEHDTGEPFVWRNTLTLKHKLYGSGMARMCQLQAIPADPAVIVRYTTDGSSPATSGAVYTEPFPVPPGAALIQAVAQAGVGGVSSETQRIPVPTNGDTGSGGKVFNRDLPATLRWGEQKSFNASGVYTFLEQADKRGGKIGGFRAVAMKDNRWLELTADNAAHFDAAAVRDAARRLTEMLPGASLSLDVESVHFESGHDLENLVIADLKETLHPDEVEQ